MSTLPTCSTIFRTAGLRTARAAALASTVLWTTLISVVVLAGVVPAAAQPGTPGSTPPTTTAPTQTPAMAPNTWALSPTGDNPAEPSSRAFFSYEVAKGSTTRDSVTLWNYGDVELTFDVYAQDAFNTPDGGFDLLRSAQAPAGVGKWIALDQNKVIVPARSGRPIPFSMNVPAEATPGDHAGGIVASVSRSGGDGGNKQVLVDHRVGSRVYLRVAGAVDQALVIERIESRYDGGINPFASSELVVTYTVRNAGNTRLRGHQQLSARGAVGWPSREQTLEDLPELLPGASVTRTHRFDDVFPAVRLSADLEITPYGISETGGAAASLEPVRRSSAVWAVPWALVVALVILIAGSRWWLRRRSRRPRTDGPRPGRADATTKDPVVPPRPVDLRV